MALRRKCKYADAQVGNQCQAADGDDDAGDHGTMFDVERKTVGEYFLRRRMRSHDFAHNPCRTSALSAQNNIITAATPSELATSMAFEKCLRVSVRRPASSGQHSHAHERLRQPPQHGRVVALEGA